MDIAIAFSCGEPEPPGIFGSMPDSPGFGSGILMVSTELPLPLAKPNANGGSTGLSVAVADGPGGFLFTLNLTFEMSSNAKWARYPSTSAVLIGSPETNRTPIDAAAVCACSGPNSCMSASGLSPFCSPEPEKLRSSAIADALAPIS